MQKVLSMQVKVARVVWVNGNGSVAKHRLRACGRDNHLTATIFELIRKGGQHTKSDLSIVSWDLQSISILSSYTARLNSETPGLLMRCNTTILAHLNSGKGLDINVINLDIREGGVEMCTPVDEADVSIDEPMLV